MLVQLFNNDNNNNDDHKGNINSNRNSSNDI